MIRVSTWNLCLGIKNKKDIVYDTLTRNKIDICALQEVEIQKDFPTNLLSSANYKIEIEQSSGKARNATVIKNGIDYTRRRDLEKEDVSLVVIDVNSKPITRIINVYRSFNPPNNKHPLAAFREQLELIKICSINLENIELIILGDFNLDHNCKNLNTYRLKNYFECADQVLDELNLIQIVNVPTWHRIINGNLKESTLDHVYIKNPLLVNNVVVKKPIIGDHSIITFDLSCTIDPPEIVLR